MNVYVFCSSAVKRHDIYPCFRLCSLSAEWVNVRAFLQMRPSVSLPRYWLMIVRLCKWAMAHKWFHLSFILYLNRNVQRIHNLPDHEWQEIDSQEHPNCCIEFPWLQVLLCEFEQRHTHTHVHTHITIQGSMRQSIKKDKQPGWIIWQASLWVLDDWAQMVFLNVCIPVCMCVYSRSNGSFLVCVCVNVSAAKTIFVPPPEITTHQHWDNASFL